MVRSSAAIFSTAFNEATKRVEETGDRKAMTLLGELYANGFGVPKDDTKAAEWYSLAADRGDPRCDVRARDVQHRRTRRTERSQRGRQAARGRPPSSAMRRRLQSRAALSRRPAVSAGLRARRRTVPRAPPRPAVRKRKYALATLYKEGRGVAKDDHEPRVCSAPRRSPTISTPRSNTAIALFNGTGRRQGRSGGRARFATCRAAGEARSRRTGSARMLRHRPRPAARSGRGDQMAHHRQGGRRWAIHIARRVRQQAKRRERARPVKPLPNRGSQVIALLRALDALPARRRTTATACSGPPCST